MSLPLPDISVIIPAYNRIEPLRLTLRSVKRAAISLAAELILVDDGSNPPLAEQLGESAIPGFSILRQPNSGSIPARQAGLGAARGEFVQFLDSDDLVHPAKFTRQIAAMRASGADISYADMADYRLSADGEPEFIPGSIVAATSDPLDFFLRIQPAPHNPIYRRAYLQPHLSRPILPPDRTLDPVGDVWIYYNLLSHPARLAKVDAPLAATGRHEEYRFSRNWECLAVAALKLMEGFAAACPRTPETNAVRTAFGECAFESWRRLPKDFDRRFDRRMLNLWRASPRGPLSRLGGPTFQALARLLGPERAGRLLRRWRGVSYEACRTVSPEACSRLLAGL